MDVKDKVIVVTGAASGLGEATACLLSEAGAHVAMLDQQIELLQKKALLYGALPVICNIADETSAQSAINSILKKYAAIHGLVNCAGVLGAGKVLSKNGLMTLDFFQSVIQTNLVGTFNMIRLCAECMLKNNPDITAREKGVIVNVASIAAFEGQVGQVAYAASKAGVAGMTLPLAREFASQGIRVMSIAPGLMETQMLQALSDDLRAKLVDQVPFPNQLGDPNSFAKLVQHIFENVYLNGETIRLDAALRLS